MSDADPVLKKILAKAGIPDLVGILAERLSNGELTSLLLEVYRRRAAALQPHALLAGLAANRFVQPATSDPLALRRADADMLELAQQAGFRPVELSPLAPLGSSALYGRVSQHKVLSALRGCEVASDPCNTLLPLMVARLSDKSAPLAELHWAGSQRVVRSNLMDFPDFKPHFALFAAVSLLRGKDPQPLIETALKHLRLQQRMFAQFGLHEIQWRLQIKGRQKQLGDHMREALAQSDVSYTVESASGTDYYQGFQLKSYATRGGQTVELGDCGCVDWAAQLKGDARLQAFISGIGIERMLALVGQT
ncbi:MAG: hypothetical protein CVV27_01900 [Candidatus Melainabacteria bacterium HGW-Melainabacteria-1]|nr:MAG: hypothetical protein CVV27_01900 [Candidatus Melainabacteria bacterium HGW-Melainabacteria-1]